MSRRLQYTRDPALAAHALARSHPVSRPQPVRESRMVLRAGLQPAGLPGRLLRSLRRARVRAAPPGLVALSDRHAARAALRAGGGALGTRPDGSRPRSRPGVLSQEPVRPTAG